MISDGLGPASVSFARTYYQYVHNLPYDYELPLDTVRHFLLSKQKKRHILHTNDPLLRYTSASRVLEALRLL